MSLRSAAKRYLTFRGKRRAKEALELEVTEAVERFERSVGGKVRTLRIDTDHDLYTGEVIRTVEVDIQ